MGRHRVAMTEVLRREAEQRGAVLGARRAAQGQANEHSRQQQRPAARAIVAAREAGAASLRSSDGRAGASVRDERDWRMDPITGGVMPAAQDTAAAQRTTTTA